MGLCYKCDESYTIGHVCKNRALKFILVDEDEKDYTKEGDELESNREQVMETFVNALAGSSKHRTIRVPGIIKGRKISILIDSGSTHSFIDEGLARELSLVIDGTETLIGWQMERN